MTDEEHIRFALALKKDKPFLDAVLDYVDELEHCLRERTRKHKEHTEKLEDKLQKYRQAYFDDEYNQREIEKTWNVINDWNRRHLELHEAVREKLRDVSQRHSYE